MKPRGLSIVFLSCGKLNLSMVRANARALFSRGFVYMYVRMFVYYMYTCAGKMILIIAINSFDL